MASRHAASEPADGIADLSSDGLREVRREILFRSVLVSACGRARLFKEAFERDELAEDRRVTVNATQVVEPGSAQLGPAGEHDRSRLVPFHGLSHPLRQSQQRRRTVSRQWNAAEGI